MSLRLQIVGAFAYVLLLILVALEVPLALNLARRIDAEVKNEAAAQAFVVSAGASGRMSDTKELRKLANGAGAGSRRPRDHRRRAARASAGRLDRPFAGAGPLRLSLATGTPNRSLGTARARGAP
jgi:hypothetical protein